MFQAAVDQRQHVLRSSLVEHPPVTSHRDVHGRRVRESPPVPVIVMLLSAEIGSSGAARGDPGMRVHFDRFLQRQRARTLCALRRRDHLPVLDDLQSRQRTNRVHLCVYRHRAAGAGQVHAVANLRSVHIQANHGAAAEKCPAFAHGLAPVVIVEFLVLRNVRIGSIHSDRHVTGHLVGPADEWKPVAAIQISVVLKVVVLRLQKHFHGIGASGRYQRGGFAVGVRQMGDNHRAPLRMAGVRPT